ncbi:MAG: SPOR domain-containing protein [Thiohalomonadales bacterium]
MDMILKQRVVGSIVIIAVLSIVLPAIVISKDKAFATKLISNIPPKPIFKIDLPDENESQADLSPKIHLTKADTAVASNDSKREIPTSKSPTKAVPNKNTLKQTQTTSQGRPEKSTTDKVTITAIGVQKKPNITIHIPLGDSEKVTKDAHLKKNVTHKEKLTSSPGTRQPAVLVSAPKGKLAMPTLTTTQMDKVGSSRKTQHKELQIANVALWVVQVGSFAKESNANKLHAKLSKQGYRSYIELVKQNNATIFRVRIGPQKNQTNAKKLQKKIRLQEKLDAIVMRYPK